MAEADARGNRGDGRQATVPGPQDGGNPALARADGARGAGSGSLNRNQGLIRTRPTHHEPTDEPVWSPAALHPAPRGGKVLSRWAHGAADRGRSAAVIGEGRRTIAAAANIGPAGRNPGDRNRAASAATSRAAADRPPRGNAGRDVSARYRHRTTQPPVRVFGSSHCAPGTGNAP